MCLSFSQNLEYEAIKWLPLEFIKKRIKTDNFKKNEEDEIVTIGSAVYEELVERFIKEIKLGRIAEILKHEAFENDRLVTCFINTLERIGETGDAGIEQLRYILQVTERENHLGALFNGSLLYWSASLNKQSLFSLLLEKELYGKIGDKFWVRIQASAALVPACWHGFPRSVLDEILNLGADINSTLHEEYRSQTHFCDYCTVHDKEGMTTIQAAVFGNDLIKIDTLDFLLSNGARFQEHSNNRPLIRAVQNYNDKEMNKEGPIECKRAFDTIIRLIDGGVDVKWRDKHDKTALWYAVLNDHVKVAMLLVEKCKTVKHQPLLPNVKSVEMMKLLDEHKIDHDFQQQDVNGKTLLHRVQDESLIPYLIQKGCSVKQRDRFGRTPIFYSHNIAIYKTFLAHGSSIDIQDYEDKTILHFIKNKDILEDILSTFPDAVIRNLIDKPDKSKRTPIFTLTSPTLLKLFMKYADVNHQAKEYEYNSMSEQSIQDVSGLGEKIYNDVINDSSKQTINKYAANFVLNLPDNFDDFRGIEQESMNEDFCSISTGISGDTSSSSDITTTKFSKVSKESDDSFEEYEDQPKAENYTVAMKLALSGKLTKDILCDLILNKADFSLRDHEGKTILHYLVTPENKIWDVYAILHQILKHIDVHPVINLKNSNGNTVLHLACSCHEINKMHHSVRTEVVKLLLEAGADENSLNNNNETPLHCLMQCNCPGKSAISSILMSNSKVVGVYSVNTFDETPLVRLCMNRDNSKVFVKDAKEAIKVLYQSEHFKEYFLSKLKDFFLTHCHMSLLETLFHCCSNLSKNDYDQISQICSLEEYRLMPSTWIILSIVDFPDKCSILKEQLKLSVEERHNLLTNCIMKIPERKTRLIVVRTLVDDTCDVNEKDSDGTPLLINAIRASGNNRHDMHRVIRYFLNRRADLDVQDKEGHTSFHHCIMSNAKDENVLKCAKLLHEFEARLDIGKPLIVAVDKNRLRTKTIKFLPKSVSPHQKDGIGNALHHLVIAYSKYGRSLRVSMSTLAALVDRGVDINMHNDDGETPLHLAIKRQVQSHVIIEMIRNGADVNKKTRPPVVKDRSKADLTDDESTMVDERRSPFQYMLIYLHISGLALLREMLKYGADPFLKDMNGQNAFHHITALMKPTSLRILLILLNTTDTSTIKSLNLPDNKGNTPLHYASTFNDNDAVWCTSLRVAVVRILLAKGFSLNVVNSSGQTPLHVLFMQYCQYVRDYKVENEKFIHNIVAMISLFLSYNVDLDIQDNNGISVRTYIEKSKREELLNLIDGTLQPEDLFECFSEEIVI